MDEEYNVNDSVNAALVGYHDLFLQQLYNESIPNLYEEKQGGGEFDPDTFAIGMQRLTTPYSDFLQGQRNIMDALERKNPNVPEYDFKIETGEVEEEPPVEEIPVEEETPEETPPPEKKSVYDLGKPKETVPLTINPPKHPFIGGENAIPPREMLGKFDWKTRKNYKQ